MARRRMFSLEIIDTDMFLEMPQTTQNLYFHLGMRADDDGFVSNPKRIMKMMSATDDDFKILQEYIYAKYGKMLKANRICIFDKELYVIKLSY